MDYEKQAKIVLKEYNFQKEFGRANFRDIVKTQYNRLSEKERDGDNWLTFFKKTAKMCQKIQPAKRVAKIKNVITDTLSQYDEEHLEARRHEDACIFEEQARGADLEILKDLGYSIKWL